MPPVLLLGVDFLSDKFNALMQGLSSANPTSNQLDIINQAKRSLPSDVFDLSLRMPIILNDVIGVQHTETDSSYMRTVFYDAGDISLADNRNAVNVRLEIKSNLSELSVMSDLLLALSSKSGALNVATKASFFSANFCILDSYMTGISRSSIKGTDKQMVTLSFERISENPEDVHSFQMSDITEEIPVIEVLINDV